ncbi:MAG: efflux RND transporter periplasmic adaptor subunit [Deltaproteobacteria bacterium]|nr:MAG: efflux RND transporter periplasmic adaptor subunit [Deltaproteobacteria bacterium]
MKQYPRQLTWSVLYALPFALAVACGGSEPSAPPLLEIPVVEVIQRDQPIELEMVGQTLGSVDIPIRARVEGVLESMDFAEGRRVKQGQLLYTIDPQPFKAKVVEAQGGLAEARTGLAKSKADLGRIRPLAEMNAVSQQDLDAAVAQYEAAIGATQAAGARLEQAEIELGYTRIHAPIDGGIGLSEAKVGEFVGRAPNPVVLNFVSQTDPIRVRFAIDERRYLKFARQLIELSTKGEERQRKGLDLILADGTMHTHRGHIVATDAAVNPTTGTFTLEADFPNPDNLVLAGQFARVRAVVETRKDALLIPQRCISELQGNFRVFVVGQDGNVELRQVQLGPKIAQLQIIESGLNPGERVALEGLLRLKANMKVVPKLAQLDDSGAQRDVDVAAGPDA